jgi:hypothetical protein
MLNEYNGDGLRVGATIDEVATHYTYDLNAPLPRVLAETQDERIVHSYYGLGMVAQHTQGTQAAWIFPLHDALGSTRQAFDDTGTQTASYQYEPFGVLSGKSSWENSVPTSFRFAGERAYGSRLRPQQRWRVIPPMSACGILPVSQTPRTPKARRLPW